MHARSSSALTHNIDPPPSPLDDKPISGCMRLPPCSESLSLIAPYYHDAVMFGQICMVDPYPALKMEGMALLRLLAAVLPDAFKTYAAAAVRAVAPALAHRHSKVRLGESLYYSV